MAFRVAILGPGALGRALGGVLERGGADVRYVGREGAIARDLRREPFPRALRPELVLITVKAYDTEVAMREAADILGTAPVLSLQNGLGNLPATQRAGVDAERIPGGSTTHAAPRQADGSAQHV